MPDNAPNELRLFSSDRSVGNVQTSYHGVSVMVRRCAQCVLDFCSRFMLKLCRTVQVHCSKALHLPACSMYDPLEDNSEIAKGEAEGQNSTLVDHQLLDAQEDCAASQEVSI